jgi:predicted nucleotide-binding protein
MLSPDETRHVISRLRKRVAELEGFDPSIMQTRFGCPELQALEAAIGETLAAAFGQGTPEFNRYQSAANLDHGPITMSTGWDRGPRHEDMPDVFQSYVHEGRNQSVALIKQAIRGLEEGLPPSPEKVVERTVSAQSQKVFVVHGHDEGALQALARFLEQLGLTAIILREQPDQGRTIIEKFEDCAAEVGFAVVLLTPDDVGNPESKQDQGRRARQNVIFELGYFAGKLGRGRACLLRKSDVEIPSDLYGVIYTDMDDADGWKLKLVRELKAAKLDFDANRMW